MSDFYRLNADRSVSKCTTKEWAEAYNGDRRVARDEINDYLISTVFLGLNHAFDDGLPMIFETMVFKSGDMSGELCERCSTWDQAIEQHNRICAQVRNGNVKDAV